MEPRPLLAEEIAVLVRALEVAPLPGVPANFSAQVSTLSVVAQDDVPGEYPNLRFDSVEAEDHLVADARGETEDGQFIEVLVWGRAGRVTAMEIVDYEASGKLPMPSSLKPNKGKE